MALSPRFLAFCVVGGIGFAVDAGALTALVHGAGLGPYAARVASFALAVSVTWALNRRWTFASATPGSKAAEYGRYFGVQAAGALINLAVYAACIEAAAAFRAYPTVALAVGSAVALLFNYAAAGRLVFRLPRRSDADRAGTFRRDSA